MYISTGNFSTQSNTFELSFQQLHIARITSVFPPWHTSTTGNFSNCILSLFTVLKWYRVRTVSVSLHDLPPQLETHLTAPPPLPHLRLGTSGSGIGLTVSETVRFKHCKFVYHLSMLSFSCYMIMLFWKTP